MIAESFDRIHRSNLIGMGIIPFQFLDGQNAKYFKLNGKEKFTIHLSDELTPKQIVEIEVSTFRRSLYLIRKDKSVWQLNIFILNLFTLKDLEREKNEKFKTEDIFSDSKCHFRCGTVPRPPHILIRIG